MSALQVTPIAAATVTPAEQISASGGFRKIVSEPEKLFTLEQVQAAGNFSRSTLYRLRHGGGLRTITIGGVTRVRERDWLAFLERHAAATPESGGNEIRLD